MAIPATTEAPPGSKSPQPAHVAQWLAGQGIYVHPLLPGRKIPPRGCARCWRGTKDQPNPFYVVHTAQECPCLSAGRYCHGVLAATTDPATIDNWWREMPDAGVGVATGKSGLLILDVDRHGTDRPEADGILPGLEMPADIDLSTVVDGLDVLALLCELRGVVPITATDSTITVQTPSGGLQLWFRVDPRAPWTPSAGKLGWQLDVRAGRSYGIAPGTTTPKGMYAALGACRTVADLPEWLSQDLLRTGHQRQVTTPTVPADWTPPKLAGGRGYVAAALRSELDKVAHAKKGERSEAINSAAYYLGQFVGAGLLEQEAVRAAITAAAAMAGVDPAERKAQDTIERGIEAGMRRPRVIGDRA
ncbi:bifunctional DNA primase/polymerase [Streptomyces osmaniensis]|uniref:Bifunctional DNA primase/polymerase n=1 Tax=Streptomyces osmaniensis TaxID=593134 RepID=A0ABP6Z219_9ACTN|nr:bifunctional DNA primase/polymerase [Streptomyces sp. JCM17656]